MPRWLMMFVALAAGCAPVRHSQEAHILDHARASLGMAIEEEDWTGRGRGRSLKIDGAAITPEMANAVNSAVLIEELWVETETPPAVAEVLEQQFEKLKDFTPSYQGKRWQVWRRKNLSELDWVERTFGTTLMSS